MVQDGCATYPFMPFSQIGSAATAIETGGAIRASGGYADHRAMAFRDARPQSGGVGRFGWAAASLVIAVVPVVCQQEMPKALQHLLNCGAPGTTPFD